MSMRFWKWSSEVVDVQQQIMRLRGEFAEMQQQAAQFRSEISELHSNLNLIQLDSVQQQRFLRESLLTLRYHSSINTPVNLAAPAKLKNIIPISKQFDLLQQIAPDAYAVWRPLLEVNEKAYDGLPVNSCSVSGHPMATLFRFFLVPYLRGRVLDIGCGPQSRPTYLEDYPVEAVYGVDPLSEPEDHPFHFIKGFAEYLAWEDDQFKVVVAATSLDHVLLLDKVFEEIYRVLSKDGVFIVWVGFVPGSMPYNPYQSTIDKVDDYHLFHFDRDWFLDAISPYFTVFEEYPVDKWSTFFALRSKKVV